VHRDGEVRAKPARSGVNLLRWAWVLLFSLGLAAAGASRQVQAEPQQTRSRETGAAVKAGGERCQDDRIVGVVCRGRSCAVVPKRTGRAAQTLTDGVEVEAPSAELPERLGDTSQEEFPWDRPLMTFEMYRDPPEAKLPPNLSKRTSFLRLERAIKRV